MKICTNKSLFKKILCIIIAIIIFSSVIPGNVSYASTPAEKIGGTLLSPIASLMIGLGDVLMDIIHNTIYGIENSLIVIEKKDEGWGIFFTVVAAILAIVVIAVVAYLSAGAGVLILAKLGITASITAATVGTIVTVSLGAGLAAGTLTALAWFGDNVVFPTYQISPEEIFRNEIPLLDINFFTTQEEVNEKYNDTINEDDPNYRKYVENMTEIWNGDIDLEVCLGDGFIDSVLNDKEEAIGYLKNRVYEIISDNGEYVNAGKMLPMELKLDKLNQTGCWFVGESAYQIDITLDFKRVYDNDYNELSKWAWGEGSIYDDYENVYQIEYRFDISIKKGKWHWVEISKTAEKTETIQDNNPYWDKHIYSTSAQDWGCEDFVSYVDFELTKMWEKMVTDYGYTRGKENLFMEWYIGPNGIPWKDLVGTHQTQPESGVREGSWGPDSNIDNVLGLPVDRELDAGKVKIYMELSYDATNDISTLEVKILSITYNTTVVEEINQDTLGLELNPVISKWYYAIRTFVLVVMMVILLYIGIRIMLCGIASEKAKYKNMLTDWIVAICLVFIMHYIMVFSINIVDGITKIFASIGNGDDPFINMYEVDDTLLKNIKEESRARCRKS